MRDESDERLDKEQTWSEMMNHKAENSNTTEKDEDVILVTYYVPSIQGRNGTTILGGKMRTRPFETKQRCRPRSDETMNREAGAEGASWPILSTYLLSYSRHRHHTLTMTERRETRCNANGTEFEIHVG